MTTTISAKAAISGVEPRCQRCGRRIAKGPGRCVKCQGKALLPRSPGWQRARSYYRDPEES